MTTAPARLLALFVALALALSACASGAEETDVTDGSSAAGTEDSSDAAAGPGPSEGMPPGGGGGPGGGAVDPTAITTEDELIEMIGGDAACGDGALDLHRGHQPMEATLVELLGISHEEMHVYMEEQDMNLAAVADEVADGRDALDEGLVEHFSPAIENLLADGTITEEQAATYQDQLEQALDFRIDWDGEEAPLDFCTASI